MYVYIIYRNTLTRISGVSLHSYSVPQCNGVLEDRLDPSLWFKVMVVDSILVHCDCNNVFYTKRKPSESEDIHGFRDNMLSKELVFEFFKDKEKVFTEEEYPEYDPTFDDLFNTAFKILQTLPKDDDQVKSYDHLFKLLHVFVLPKIKIDANDKADVEKVLKDIEKCHEETENQIQLAMKSEKNTESSLNEQTKQLLRKQADFSRPSYVAACHHEFIGLFLERLDKYIAKCRDDIRMYAAKIEPIRDSSVEEDVKKLRLLRSERDLVKEGFDRAIVVREEIKINIRGQNTVHEHIHQLSFGFQNSYVKTYRCLQMRQEEVPKMIRTKIKISAVREAVMLTLKEIDSDGDSYGYNRVKGSFDADSDILDLNQVPDEWASLPAKVKHLLENPKAEFEGQHSQFCGLIKNTCQQLLNTSGTGGINPGNFLLADTNCYSSRWSSGSISKDSCEKICLQITSHISEIAEKLSVSDDLADDFRENPQKTRDKVYMCYGEKVTAELIPVLCKVYEESYRTLSKDLSEFLTTVIVHEVFSAELKMLNKIISKQNRAEQTDSVVDDDHPYEPVSFEDQRAALPKRHTDSGYESMDNLQGKLGLNRRNTCAIIPESQGEDNNTEPVFSELSMTSTVLRHGVKSSRRKRYGVSLTAEQADNLMVVIPEGDGWFDQAGYVDMKMTSSVARGATTSLNKLYSEFADFQLLVKEEIAATTMTAKLRSLTGILKFVEGKLSDMKAKAGDSEPACADDLIGVIILLLLKVDPEDLLKLYAHMNLLDHLWPNFMMGNIHSYALVTLQGPYHMLFEQATLRKK